VSLNDGRPVCSELGLLNQAILGVVPRGKALLEEEFMILAILESK
jgi:hypothetical protein